MPRICTVCTHPLVEEINKELIGGATAEAMSKAYGLARSSVQRHKDRHIPQQLAEVHKAKELASGESLISQVIDLKARAENSYNRAVMANHIIAEIQAIRELRAITELSAKISGEISTRSVTNIVIMPEWVMLRGVILRALEPYPEARRAVTDAVGRLET